MNAAPLIPMSPRPESYSIGSPAQMRIPLTSPGKIKTEIEERGKEIPLTPLPPISAGKLPPISAGKLPTIAMTAKSPLPPPPSAAVALPPLSKTTAALKATLPPLSKPAISEVPKTTLPPISTTAPVAKATLPPIAAVSLPPISPAPVSKTTLPPLTKLNLPPLSKPTQAELGQTSLPPLSEVPKVLPISEVSKATLPPIIKSPVRASLPSLSEAPKTSLPPIIKSPAKSTLHPIIKSPTKSTLPPLSEAPKSTLPPLSAVPKSTLSPLSAVPKSSLPPIIKSPVSLPPISKLATGKPTAAPPLSSVGVTPAPLAVEVKEKKAEQVEKIRVEVKKAEERQLPKLGGIEPGTLAPLKSLKPMETKEIAKLPSVSEIKTLKPLPSLKSPAPEIKSLVAPPPALTALEEAREGVRTAKGAEEQAAFQGNLATIASPANLPSKKAKDTTPKIRIPKIAGLAVKSSPKRVGKAKGKKGEIELPSDSTVIPSIPITSPQAMKIPKAVTSSADNDLLKIINSIDVSKLRADRVKDKEAGYNVNDLKTLAGALNLPKSGNKKDLVDRIKALILKVKPNTFDQ